MWRDMIQIAVSNAIKEGATKAEVEEHFQDMVESYDWPEDE